MKVFPPSILISSKLPPRFFCDFCIKFPPRSFCQFFMNLPLSLFIPEILSLCWNILYQSPPSKCIPSKLPPLVFCHKFCMNLFCRFYRKLCIKLPLTGNFCINLAQVNVHLLNSPPCLLSQILYETVPSFFSPILYETPPAPLLPQLISF